MHVLSCGAGMQSSALALMSCENVMRPGAHPGVPVYDAIVFANLGCEPAWVYRQVDFIANACEDVKIPFYVLESDIYNDHVDRIRHGKFVKMPLWTLKDGKKGKLRRSCTIDYKIIAIQQFIRYELLGYRKHERNRPEDIGAHTMHIGFSAEEKDRIFDSQHPFFTNKFPLAEMGLQRKDNYRYCLETWGFDTKASSCYICPFHKNFFYQYLRDNYPKDYIAALEFDKVLSERPENGRVTSELFLTYSCKRLSDLSDTDCNDAEVFPYRNRLVWNGF